MSKLFAMLMGRRLFEQESGDGGSGGGGGATTPPAGGTPAGTPLTGSTPPAGAWYDGFQDQGVKDWVKSYGKAYETPEAMALKAYNLEKFVGAEKAGRGVVTPKADAKPEEWAEFYKKVGGAPEKPEGYKVPDAHKDDPLLKSFAETMHKAGLPPMFFGAAMEWYEKSVVANANNRAQQSAEQFEQQAAKEWGQLREDWKGRTSDGVEVYDRNVEVARRAAAEFVPHANKEELQESLQQMEAVWGPRKMMQFFANLGNSVGEHTFVSGSGGGGGANSPEAARMRIAELKKDTGFQTKFISGDADARREWDNLHKVAYGDRR